MSELEPDLSFCTLWPHYALIDTLFAVNISKIPCSFGATEIEDKSAKLVCLLK